MDSSSRSAVTASKNETSCCLTVAGSDSGGNAGVQADLRVFHDYGFHGCTAFAALTAQNPSGVSAIHAVPADFVAAQLDAVLGVYDIRALKTGMLGDAAVIGAVADRLYPHLEIAKVVDPVMIATSGAKLIADDSVETLKRRLLPLATLITPNIPEAAALCGRSAPPAELAHELSDTYGCAVLVKGGHSPGADAVDVLCDVSGEMLDFSMPWVHDPVSTHGTGCSMSAAIAAELALGHSLADAVAGAKWYVHAAIAGSRLVGKECGVLGFVRQKRGGPLFDIIPRP